MIHISRNACFIVACGRSYGLFADNIRLALAILNSRLPSHATLYGDALDAYGAATFAYLRHIITPGRANTPERVL